MDGLTVNDLHKLIVRQINLGNGDKTVLISADDEGNGFHTLFYGFTAGKEDVLEYSKYGLFHDKNDPNTVVLLG